MPYNQIIKIMKYAIMLGSNMFIGTNGVLKVQKGDKVIEFFKIREVFKARSEGSYLAVDCDIKDVDNVREVKLFKNKPVVKNDELIINSSDSIIEVIRQDGTVIIKIEQINDTDPLIPQDGPIKGHLDKENIDTILRITGNYYAGDYLVTSDETVFKVGPITLSGNLAIGTGGLQLTNMGFSF